MSRADAIVGYLLEADEFDPRSFILSNEHQIFAFIDDVKALLKLWFDEVEVYPAVEGTALYTKFAYGANRYRIRCKRSQAVPTMEPTYGHWSRAKEFKRRIEQKLYDVAIRHEFFVTSITFAGDTYRNLLIIVDAGPLKANEKVNIP